MWWFSVACAEPPAPFPAPPISLPPPALPAPTPASPTLERAVTLARASVGTEWRWNGRGTERLPGLDCLGVIFRAYGEATGTDWREYPVDPSKLVHSGLLGHPVPGLDGALRSALDVGKLARGDVLYFLVRDYEIPDEPLLVSPDGGRYWPWHTGIWLGDGEVLNSHPQFGVLEMPLEDIRFDALFVTRLDR